jgi:hypothetical protein
MAHIRPHGPIFTFPLLQFEAFKIFTYTQITNFNSVWLHTTIDNQFLFIFLMFSYGFPSFIITYINVKFNLNQYTFHGHEKTHVNLCFHIHVGE